ncbi:MAG: hypothetical protein LBG52_01270 [Candidatus Peribacteria bacterium]|jgi:hypothetical protein|nr:hypothetical protein [Candidatus Peribacteria bacterium]
MKKIIFFGLIMYLFLGCEGSGTKTIATGVVVNHNVITGHGHGVFYFNVVGENFCRTLSAFMGSHSDLGVVSIAGNGSPLNGAANGYVVIFSSGNSLKEEK